MNTLHYSFLLLSQSLKYRVKSLLLRVGCFFHPSWFHIDNDSICTTGKVIRLEKIYTYEDDGILDIVRLTDVHFERGYLFCSLFFFSKNQIVTVRHTLLKGTKVALRLLDNRDYDELMAMRLWQEVIKEEELLEFDF
jgi:hypothetical protein